VVRGLDVATAVALDRLHVELAAIVRPRQPREITLQLPEVELHNRLRRAQRHLARVGGRGGSLEARGKHQ
jgi:hypothetical protein